MTVSPKITIDKITNGLLTVCFVMAVVIALWAFVETVTLGFRYPPSWLVWITYTPIMFLMIIAYIKQVIREAVFEAVTQMTEGMEEFQIQEQQNMEELEALYHAEPHGQA